ncbi:MAG: transcriptional regulator PpsR [Proteobacteria bacterium]|nr:transcriptional regulator PpsR [Pseudomonadota bacterium]
MKNLKKSIGSLDPDSAARLALLGSDIAVVLDREGVVKDLSICNDSLSKDSEISSWIGKRWVDTVTVESRPKIELLLKDALAAGKQAVQWRQVNHPIGSGRSDLPMRYAAMPVRSNGPIIAVGRELRALSLMQQKLLESQQAVEREYARVRYAELRYRTLFQTSSEAIFILDAATLRITEANPSAQSLMGQGAKRITGKAFTELFDGPSQQALQRLLDLLRTSGRADPVSIKVGSKGEMHVSGSVYRHELATHILVKLQQADELASSSEGTTGEVALRSLVERMPDAFVVTDLTRHVLTGNAAFLALTGLVSPDQIKGQLIDRWIGRSPAEFNLLIGSLKEHGSVRRFSTVVRDELGGSEEVEISAVAAEDAPEPSYGFSIRFAARTPATETWLSGQLPQSANQMAALVGQVPLKNLVREATDLIERMCIEAALQIVGDNRASAAEVLGLSRQSLYMKMRRYGLGDLGSDD